MNTRYVLINLLVFTVAAVILCFSGCTEPKKYTTPVGPKPAPKQIKKAVIPAPKPTAEEPPDDGTFYSDPLDNVPYELGPGDQIMIRIKEASNFDHQVTVSVAGTILPKLLGAIAAAGQKIDDLKAVLTKEYDTALIKNPTVSVDLVKGREQNVFVAGSLPKSGKQIITGQPSLLQVLTLSGWTEDSPVRNVTIVRKSKFKSISLEKLITGKELKNNIILKDGDLLIASKDFPITVTGAVVKPGKYNLDGAVNRSIAWIIAKAGGINNDAALDAAKVIAKNGSERLIDLNPILFGDANQSITFISAGETLYIPASKKIKIFVLGMVNSPGQFTVDDGITVTQAIALADFERFGAVMDRATLITGYFSQNVESVTFDLGAVLEGNIKENFRMENGSVLFIPESVTSDVLDFLERLLSPLSGTATLAVRLDNLGDGK